MRLEMERVDDVRVVEVDRRCLVRDVDGMRERQVPHGEGLELGIARGDTALVLMIELGQAGSELAGARTRRRHDDERTRSLDELVLAVALLAHDKVDIVGVALNGVMELAGNAEHGEAAAELVAAG